MIWRLALALFPELQSLAKVILLCLFGLLLLAPTTVGMHSQSWSPWWFAGNASAPPGVVPPAAGLPPQGPLPVQTSSLMTTIQPWMGTRYLFGGCTLSGVDCSCFVQNVARVQGVSLPRTAQLQYDATERVAHPQVGDLVFFERTYDSRPDRISHVGFYIGDSWMISAIEPAVGRQSLNDPFWRSHLAGYGRVRWPPSNQA
jgi:hypothetical protein